MDRQTLIRIQLSHHCGLVRKYIGTFVCEACIEVRTADQHAGNVNIQIDGKVFSCPVCTRCVAEIQHNEQ